MPTIIERKPPPTGDNGQRTPQDKIDDMREFWVRGDPIHLIASWCGVRDKTVTRYCADLPRPERSTPLSTEEIARFMRRWKP